MKLTKLIKNPKPFIEVAMQRLKNRYRTHFNKGTHVLCEICGRSGSRFFNGRCPKCNSLPRTRLIPFSLRHFNLMDQNLKILHIAPNPNEYTYVKNTFKNLAQYDRLNICAVPHINIVQDITKSTLADNTYDLVIVWHVLEHIVADRKAASEIYRILKPGGNLLMSVPIYPIGNPTTFEDEAIKYEDYEAIHGHNDHCRSCGLDYFKRFEEIGFTTRTLCKYAPSDLTKFGLSKNHVVWCFTV